MGNKTNLRSFRYSDEVAAILESQEGKSLNDKFETLVLQCFRRLPEEQRRLELIQADCQRERDKMVEYRQQLREFDNVFRSLAVAKNYLMIVCDGAEKIAGM